MSNPKLSCNGIPHLYPCTPRLVQMHYALGKGLVKNKIETKPLYNSTAPENFRRPSYATAYGPDPSQATNPPAATQANPTPRSIQKVGVSRNG